MVTRTNVLPPSLYGLLAVCALGLTACHNASSQTKLQAPAQTVAVKTTTPRRIVIERPVDVSGTLLSPDQAKVSSEAAGVVLEVPIELGRDVKPGDVLVRLEPRELALALERAESALRQVEAQLGIDSSRAAAPPPDEQIAAIRQAAANRDDARSAMERADELHRRSLVSRVDRDAADTRMKVAEANYQATLDMVRSLKASLQDRRAAVDLARKKLNDAVIRAPVTGSIAERLVQPGEYIRENTHVATVVQMHPLKLKTAVQEKHAGAIKAGQTVRFRVEAFPDRLFDGRVAFVAPAVDQATRTFAIEAVVDNPDRVLKPGFFAQGSVIVRRDEDVLAVPDDAVSTLAGVSTVYVVDADTVRQQIIGLGVRQRDVWEVTSGLAGTETLAASNLGQLATGTKVKRDHGPAQAAAGDRPAGGNR